METPQNPAAAEAAFPPLTPAELVFVDQFRHSRRYVADDRSRTTMNIAGAILDLHWAGQRPLRSVAERRHLMQAWQQELGVEDLPFKKKLHFMQPGACVRIDRVG